MKFLRVNLETKRITSEDVPPAHAGLGGRGLTASLLNAEVPPNCDPLGPENKLIFAPGILTGTPLVNTSRVSVGAKSPLTGGIKESNAGGTAPAALGRLGLTAVIVEGQAAAGELYLLRIDQNGQAALVDARAYQGMRTYALVDRLLQEYGEKNGILCIGPAGEQRLALASIQSSDVDGRPCRAAGRGGLGAVMGSKGLKAILVDRQGRSQVPINDPPAFKAAAGVFAQALKNNVSTGQTLPSLGTAGLVSAVNSLGAFPSYNATRGTLEGWEKISGEKLAEIIRERGGNPTHMGCSQCAIHCSNVFVDQQGKYVTSSLEYETLWSMGGMTGIADLDVIAKLDFLSDDIGLDTMGAGVAIAVAMDAGHRPFGDAQAALDLMEEMAVGTPLGRVLGGGAVAVGRHFHHHRVPAVKGQSIAAYDPRVMQANGVTYATSPMGADHTAGNLIGSYTSGKLTPLVKKGQVEASRAAQVAMAALDCTGLCLLAGSVLAQPEAAAAYLTMINARLGTRLGPDDLTAMGRRTLLAEREFNRQAGLTDQDDRLAEFFYQEPLPPHNQVFLIEDEELDRVFDF